MRQFKTLFLVIILGVSFNLTTAQISGESPPFALSVDQLKSWTTTGSTSDAANVSTVPLANRFTQQASQLNSSRTSDMKVLYCPDGINNKGNYTIEQNKFNLFNFTHWQHIDLLNWFGGTASLNVMIPSKPWIEAAHRNGVKVLGTVFFAPAAWGGNSSTVSNFLEKNGSNYISAGKLIEIANFYGFDGWLINEETSVSSSIAADMLAFMKQLHSQKPSGMEIIWYDAMTTSGYVSWQNQFNSTNLPFVKDGSTRSSDGIFINYNWNASMATNSATVATNNGISPFEVFMGADLWPDRNAQPVFSDVTWMDDLHNGNSPKTSVALFATNFTFDKFNTFNNDPTKVADFYDTEVRFFAGEDRDIDATDPSGWKGIGHYIPARSVISSLPFETSFNTGHGRIFANQGSETTKDWHDMSKQEILPSWQWAMTGNNNISASFDFTTAYNGGNSVKVNGNLTANETSTLKLFKTKVTIENNSKIDITLKKSISGVTNAKLFVAFSDSPASLFAIDLGSVSNSNWTTKTIDISSHNGKEMILAGVQFLSASNVSNYALNIGKIKLYNSGSGGNNPVVAYSADKTTVTEGESVSFTNTTTNATSWSWNFPGGTPTTSSVQNPTVTYNTEGIYNVSLTATGSGGSSTLTKPSYITVNSTDIDFTDPVGTGTITARAEINANENRLKAFDNLYTSSNGTKWLDNGGVPSTSNPSWIQIELPSAKQVTKLVIISANDDYGRDPKDFRLVASNDGSSYTTLGSWSNQIFTSRYQEKSWNVSNSSTYKYYKLEITKNDENVSMTQLSEIKLIGPNIVSNKPAANFTANNQTITEGESVTFTDNSTNSPTSWSWTFTGGTPASSTGQNPVVAYNSPGTYDVSLTATNADGSGSITKTGFITVNTNTPTYCSSQSSNINYEWVAGVTIGSFNKTSTAQNYSDFTSSTISLGYGDHNITLTPGFSGNAYQEYWKIWIDFNKDGDFEDSGEELYSGRSNSALSGTITIPQSASGTKRLRVKMDYNNAPSPCGSFTYGEVEDYTVSFTGVAATSLKKNKITNNNNNIPISYDLRIYPNPVEKDLTIEGDISRYGSISVYSISGNLILKESISENRRKIVDISGLEVGYYIVSLKGDEEKRFKIYKK